MSLLKIAKKYPTTKNDHEYIQLYEKYLDSFRHQEINILEIGIDKGYSLKMWREYFTKAKICAIDIIDNNISVPNTDIMIGDQSDYDFLKKITDKYTSFDIVIDDGSHHSKHIIASFKYLFNYLNRNGIYIIEDLQTSYIPRFGGNRFNLNKKNTSMNFLKRLTDSINYEHYDKPFFSNFIFDGSVKSIYFHQNISFVTKGESKKFFFNKIKNSTLIDKIKKIASYVYS